jgi:hypothetical protein
MELVMRFVIIIVEPLGVAGLQAQVTDDAIKKVGLQQLHQRVVFEQHHMELQ